MRHRLSTALSNAKEAGENILRKDQTTAATDDPDCYPHGIFLTNHVDSKIVDALKELPKELSWFEYLPSKNQIVIKLTTPFRFRLTEYGCCAEMAKVLMKNGIDCYADANWK